jgi:hypothetical protein
MAWSVIQDREARESPAGRVNLEIPRSHGSNPSLSADVTLLHHHELPESECYTESLTREPEPIDEDAGV